MVNKMKKRHFLSVLISLLITAVVVINAAADYSYRVPRSDNTIEINSDGSMNVFVEYEFENLGQLIDYVDIGLPNNNYKLSDIQVSLNGEANSSIKVVKADYDVTGLRYGITLDMGSASIRSGESGVLSVFIPNLGKNLYEATSETIDEEEVPCVGFNFSPNYFGSKYVKGVTKYSFIIVFPPEIGDGSAYYYEPDQWPENAKPEAWLDEDGRVVYEWYSENANMYTAYTFGGKFSKSALTDTVNITASGSGGTSGKVSLWDEYGETIIGILTCIGLPALFLVLGVKTIIDNSKNTKKLQGKYFPPQIKTDGEGIKRGLTAVEAAVLLETDLERVISMILYGLAKKEVINVNSMEPLDVEIMDPLPENLHEYEKDFINALRETNKGKQKTMMRESMHRLILATSNKVAGFSLKETREYYKGICDKAWEQVEAADTPELKSQLLGDNFGWTMLEDEPEKRIERTFTDYDFYPPRWWWRVDPGYRHYHFPSSSRSTYSSSDTSSEKRSGGSSSKPTAMPVLPGAMFARSITRSAQDLGKSLTGNMNAFKSSVKGKTNPEPVTSPSSSHRHGGGGRSGGGSSCACACACDSCACACAGGGR